MFLQASVILSTGGGGVSALVHAGIPPPGADHPSLGSRHPPWSRHPPEQTPPEQTTPGSRHTPPGSRHPPMEADTPPGSRLQHNTVNERPVRILLECILDPSCVPILLASFRVLISVFFKHLRWYDNQFQSSCLSSRVPLENRHGTTWFNLIPLLICNWITNVLKESKNTLQSLVIYQKFLSCHVSVCLRLGPLESGSKNIAWHIADVCVHARYPAWHHEILVGCHVSK